jgi:foldase protein PrsA
MRRLALLMLVAPLALLAAACGGGGGSVSKDDAAVVDGQHISRTELDRRMQQAQCSYELQKKQFPKAGSPEFQAIQVQVLDNIVKRIQLDQQAPKLGASVSDKKVEDQLKQIKKQYFGGSEKKYQSELKRQCVTDTEVHADVRSNLLSDAIFRKVTASAKVTDAEVKDYYFGHPLLYAQPQTRVVRHILVKSKKTADTLYAQIKKNPALFAELAKKFSQDPGSKSQGGRLTISKGQTVPEFDKVAFALKTGELSKPVHTQFGWHIIQALKPPTPRKTTPFEQVRNTIRQQLLQERRNTALKQWLDDLKKQYASKITYARGLAPAPTSTTSPTTTG